MARTAKLFGALVALQAALSAGMVYGLAEADRAYPPPLQAAMERSRQVLDRDGQLLRAFTTSGGKWRLPVTAADVDPHYLRMLVAYEDQRFEKHRGVDLWALGRAAGQLAAHGRIVSGGSTLSMQVARLIEPRKDRSIAAKLIQIARAAQIEKRLSKAEILDLYLNLAPFGGNLEGVRAASLAYFGKEPKRLTVAQSALLVALPQLPERRRPDRFPANAEAARERVLTRLAVAAVIGEGEAGRARLAPVPNKRRQLPAYAAHLAEAAIRKDPRALSHQTTLKRDAQAALEIVARDAAERLGPKISVALLLAESRTGAILAEVGSADYFEGARSGWIDMTRTLRSPGSTLKPFIYGLAFEQGMIAQQTIIEDRPADFFGYRPKNFDMSYQGDVTIRQALQMSLNVPAVKLLEAVGPTRLTSRFRRAGVNPKLPQGEAPGLAIALGGAGVSLRDLVQLYAALANRGFPVRLGDGVREEPGVIEAEPIMDPIAAWQVSDVLSGMRPPLGAIPRGLAYKTGTSYGYRDAWTVGYDGKYVLGVWVGRADNAAIPGISGFQTAAPILFEAFAKAKLAQTALPPAPAGAFRLSEAELPASLKRFALTGNGLVSFSAREPAPKIVYPPEGAEVDLALGGDDAMPLQLKLQGGRPPFRWLANGRPMDGSSRKRNYEWRPDGAGYSTLTVIDAVGRASTVRVFVR